MRKAPTQDQIDNIAVKFIMNLPKEELSEKRIGYHFERAYFFFVDNYLCLPLIGDEKQKEKEMTTFFKMLLSVLWQSEFPKHSPAFICELINKNYRDVPAHGIILFNLSLTKILLVRTAQSTKYSFPKGKIREGESQEECAYRQFHQQVGFTLKNENSLYSVKIDSFGKFITFYVHKIEQRNIRAKKMKDEATLLKHTHKQIKEIRWFGYPEEFQKMAMEKKLNAASLGAAEELKKKMKNQLYKEKKKVQKNPLEQFSGFTRRIFD